MTATIRARWEITGRTVSGMTVRLRAGPEVISGAGPGGTVVVGPLVGTPCVISLVEVQPESRGVGAAAPACRDFRV
jgi:hypothetical protein